MLDRSLKRPGFRSVAGYVIFIALASCSTTQEDKKDGSLSDKEIQELSEAMGHLIIENLNTQNFKMDIDYLIRGIKEAASNGAPPLPKKEFYKKMSVYKRNILKVKGSENLKLAEEFLSDNQNDPRVTTLLEGKLQYIMLHKGDGAAVEENSIPVLKYEGKLIDGTVFDSSERRGNPRYLPLLSTIPGVRLGVKGMHEREKRRIFIHPDLGYGMQGSLPPNSLLIFDVEVVKASRPNDLMDQDEDSAEEERSHSESMNTSSSFQWIKKLKKALL